MKKESADLLISHAGQLVTCAETPGNNFEIIRNGHLAVKGKNIIALGSREEVLQKVDIDKALIVNAQDKVVAPGFVDCHTHLVFGGSRVEEYAAKLTVSDPGELKKMGIKTGIMVTVNATRHASEETLFLQSSARLRKMLRSGTTTVESKSGYGLSTKSELSMLGINKQLEKAYPIRIVSTFLGAHGWPEDIPKARYMDILKEEMIPQVAEKGLANFCDIWCDDGHYTARECREILEVGATYGLAPKIHTGAYSYIGGADLAAEMGMISADHLNYTPREALKKLVKAGVVGVLLPGIDFAVNHPLPFNPHPMREEGLTMALATNCCPGCWCESMQFIMVLGCRRHALSPEEALKAATLGGAKALGLEKNIGSLEVGKAADIQVWNVPRFEDAIYHLGGNVVETVIQGGKIVVDREALV